MMWIDIKRSIEVILFLLLSFVFLIIFVLPICMGLLIGDLGMQIWAVLTKKGTDDED